jgi:hypothetical protein
MSLFKKDTCLEAGPGNLRVGMFPLAPVLLQGRHPTREVVLSQLHFLFVLVAPQLYQFRAQGTVCGS